ncbi:MAG: hypothetical protein AAF985_22605, partial [Bacteroidota bacterium]
MSALQNIVKFFRDCYQFEFSTEKVANFYASSVTELFYPPTFKLLSRKDYDLPIATDWGQRVATELELSSSEKKLVCGSFFLKGKMVVLGRSRRIFTPLLLHDAVLNEEEEVYTLSLDSDSLSLNPIAIQYLNAGAEQLTHAYDEIATA